MNKKLLTMGLMSFVLIGVLSLPKPSLAYRGDPSVKGPNYTEERHNAMTKAFENNDYNAWKTLMGDRGVTKRINAQNFSKFAEAHKLALQGKLDEAKKIRTELGLGMQNSSGNGQKMGYGRTNR